MWSSVGEASIDMRFQAAAINWHIYLLETQEIDCFKKELQGQGLHNVFYMYREHIFRLRLEEWSAWLDWFKDPESSSEIAVLSLAEDIELYSFESHPSSSWCEDMASSFLY